MRNKIKKIISGLMCMALLVVCAVPVNAAQYMGVEAASICYHNNTGVRNSEPIYISAGSSTHRKMITCYNFCTDCGDTLDSTKFYFIEDHSWDYRDLGHAGGYHNYEVVCRYCYHTEKAVIYCPNENGPHNTP